ncbi:MAG: family 10 glycosylhydrolase [Bacteroidales bacterium]|nr:family 10 glycosylhydrolase [Bacteroidales bacterium]
MMKLIGYVLLLAVVFAPQAFSQYHPKTEMRAVWIATVNNVDWPSKPGLTTEEQKKEITGLLDKLTGYNLNTVIFQVRPAADAFYPSAIEPWSWWLTGEQGKAPEPFYDPLEFMIRECRKRGFDIHVWLNPYRAVTDTANIVSVNHITRIHPEWFLTYGKTVYFDPGLPQTRDYVSSVAGDIVRRYDIDAVHMDDYFYPYRISGKEFPDDSSFCKFPNGFSPDDKEDWRRDNVNRIIRQLSDTIKAVKPWVEFGISPFGVWRNSDKDTLGSETRAGQTNYDDLYADILLWQKEGWIDYIVPQIYWHIGFEVADYEVLSDWWNRNAFGCRLYIGQAPYRINRKAAAREWRSSMQITRQVKMNRKIPLVSGSVYFSAKVLRDNPLRLKERLTRDLYRYPALPPSNNRIDPVIPGQPFDTELTYSVDSLRFSWRGRENTKKFVIYKLRRNKPADLNDPANILQVTSDTLFSAPSGRNNNPGRYYYMVSSMSRTNTESDPVYF